MMRKATHGLIALAAAGLATAPVLANETRAQHREWMRKLGGPDGSAGTSPAPPAVVPFGVDVTREQHQGWMMKFGSPGGTLDGDRLVMPVERRELDLRGQPQCRPDEQDLASAGC